jgi:hypothetical protein
MSEPPADVLVGRRATRSTKPLGSAGRESAFLPARAGPGAGKSDAVAATAAMRRHIESVHDAYGDYVVGA